MAGDSEGTFDNPYQCHFSWSYLRSNPDHGGNKAINSLSCGSALECVTDHSSLSSAEG
jgi:hypothetical protein